MREWANGQIKKGLEVPLTAFGFSRWIGGASYLPQALPKVQNMFWFDDKKNKCRAAKSINFPFGCFRNPNKLEQTRALNVIPCVH